MIPPGKFQICLVNLVKHWYDIVNLIVKKTGANDMSILITSDSTCDLSPVQVQSHGIELFPLYIVKEEKPYRDGMEIFPADIFAHVAAGGSLCATSAVNLADYMERFRVLSAKYDAVIHVNISSDFSSCYQNAKLAAAEFPNVYVVDSRNLSTGHGHVVLAACEMAEAGMAAPEIVARLEELIPKVSASFILDQLEYMKKGGRCSSVMALGANLLKLKPCIEVTDGKMHVGKKYRGSLVKCLQAYVEDRLNDLDAIDPHRIFITHTDMPQEALQAVHEAVEGLQYFEEVADTNAGCTVSCHCGPGTLGILYLYR